MLVCFGEGKPSVVEARSGSYESFPLKYDLLTYFSVSALHFSGTEDKSEVQMGIPLPWVTQTNGWLDLVSFSNHKPVVKLECSCVFENVYFPFCPSKYKWPLLRYFLMSPVELIDLKFTEVCPLPTTGSL